MRSTYQWLSVSIASLVLMTGCIRLSTISPEPAVARTAKEASELSAQILHVVDETVSRYGYAKVEPLPSAGAGVTVLAVYYKSDEFTHRSKVYIDVYIGGLREVNGPIQSRSDRTLANVVLSGKNGFEVNSMTRAISRNLCGKFKKVRFEVEAKSEFTFV